MSHSFARLELACRKTELHMGWPSDRGRFDGEVIDGEIELRPKPAAHWEQIRQQRELGLSLDNKAAREQQRRMGSGFLRDSNSRGKVDQIKDMLDTAASWSVVHKALSGIGFMYQRYRSGARLVETTTNRHMPASGLGARYGLSQMCKRLGGFIAVNRPLTLVKPCGPSDAHRNLRALKRKQIRERKSMQTKLRGVRSPEAQAFRVILREDHADEIRALKEILGLPRPRLKPEEIKSVLDRYGHAIRQRMSGLTERDDHTARRQNWMVNSGDAANDLPEVLSELVDRYPESIRTDGQGTLLFAAYGMDGSILSLDRLALLAMPPELMPATSNGGVCAIGPHPANTCLLVRSHLDAISEMLGLDGPMPIVIVVGDAPDPCRMAQIEWLTKGRNLAIAKASFEDMPELMDQLRRTFPKAKIWGNGSKNILEQERPLSDEYGEAPLFDDGPSC
jgi:hypothetical protein